jgi:hypothetical protein
VAVRYFADAEQQLRDRDDPVVLNGSTHPIVTAVTFIEGAQFDQNNITSVSGPVRRSIDEFERVRRMAEGEFILTGQFPYGLTNSKVPAGDEVFTPLPLPVASKPFAPLMTPSFE